jgi:hypothetical protein
MLTWADRWVLGGFFFAPDDGNGGNDTDDGPGGDATGGGGPNAGITFTPEQQAHIDKIVGEARKAGRTKAAQEAEAEKKRLADEAERKRLEDEKQFKELADQRQKELDEAKAALEAERATVRRFTLEGAFRRETATQKLQFANEQAAADAFALLDLREAEVSDDGQVPAMAGLVKGLAKSRPYLFQSTKPGSGGTNADDGRGDGPPPNDEARKEEVKRRFRVS